jgi:CheY-like chemotaxis protein
MAEPVATASEVCEGGGQSGQEAAVNVPLRILVVDDHRDSADAISALLRHAGDIVATAYDGYGALAIAEEFCPQVALLDIDLPDMSGYEVAVRFRQRFGFANLFLMATTARGSPADRALSRAVGFDYHLQKPYGTDQVNEALGRPTKQF